MKRITEITKLIERKFSFLIERDFKIVDKAYYDKEFGNWIVALESPKFKIRLREDREDVFLSVGPTWAPSSLRDFSSFFDLEIVMVYLTSDKNYYPTIARRGGLDNQLESLAELVNKYYFDIADLFNETFADKEADLTSLGERLFSEFLKSAKKGNGHS